MLAETWLGVPAATSSPALPTPFSKKPHSLLATWREMR